MTIRLSETELNKILAKKSDKKTVDRKPKYPISFYIPLVPVTKKNSMVMIPRVSKAGRPYAAPIPSKRYRDYEKAAAEYLEQFACNIAEPVNIRCIFYMPTRRRVDLTNLLEAIDDVMVKAGVLEDDNCCIISGHDGSRVRYDKESPRTEIIIERMVKDEQF